VRKDLKRRIEEELHGFERFQLAEEETQAVPVSAKASVRGAEPITKS
jgi:hypothetical protein